MDDWKAAQRAWALAFREDQARCGRSLEAVVADVDIALNSLKNYLAAKTRLPPHLLARLAASVDGSALKWATILGYLPEDLYLAGQSLERARRETRSLQTELFQLRQQGSATGAVVAAAGASGRWTVTVEPCFEGPNNCKLRLGDLVRIRAATGGQFSARELRAEPLLSEALTLSSAVRQPTAVWDGDPRPVLDSATDMRDEWIWVVPHLNVTRPAATIPVQLPVRGICVFSTHTGGWPLDVASLAGRALGWASTSTGILSNTTLGEDLREQPFNDPNSKKAPARAALAADLLAHASSGDPTVWAHVARGAQQVFADTLSRVSSSTLLVYLRPTDTLHRSMVSRVVHPATLTELEEARAGFDEAVRSSGFDHLSLDVGFPSDLDPTDPLTRAQRDAYCERSMQVALQLLEHLHTERRGPPLQDLHEDTPPLVAQLAQGYVGRTGDLWTNQAPCTKGRAFV